MFDLFSVAMELVAHAQREEQLQIARENLAVFNRQEIREIQKWKWRKRHKRFILSATLNMNAN